MTIRTASAEWQGTIHEGHGHMRTGSGAFDGAYSYNSRFGDGGGANPEELLGAAHAGCFSMALAVGLTKAGFKPTDIRTTASVHFDPVNGAPTITLIELILGADVPGIDDATFQKIAADAKANCPISRALAGTIKVTLDATLKG
jgi:osmotically inducible protein OsmC